MSFIEIMQLYFRGEKLEAICFILPIGALLVLFGVVALKAERGGFAWGIAIPCFLFGIILMATGMGIGIRTAGQVAEIKNEYETSPVTIAQKELTRMEKVNTNFKITFIAFGVITVIGLILIFLISADWAKGLGSALVLLAAIGFLIDGFAGRRAVPYTAALGELAEKHQGEAGIIPK